MSAYAEDGVVVRVEFQREGFEAGVPGNYTVIAIAQVEPASESRVAIPPGHRWWHAGELDLLRNPIGDRVAFAAPPGVDLWLIAKALCALRRDDPDHDARLRDLGPLEVRTPGES